MIKTKIFFSSDHAGYELKNYLINLLIEKYKEKYIIEDFGTNSKDSVDYPIYAKNVCNNIQDISVNCEPTEIGIVICGSGIGMSIVCNRFTHIRCALCHNVETAKLSRTHNNANVLALGARLISFDEAFKILDEFLNNSFYGSKYLDRLKKI